MLDRAIPLVFVLIWATGFIVARLVAGHADPLTFLCLRYVGTIVALSLWCRLAGARWPRGRREWGRMLLAGVLLQALYLGGVFWSVRHGLQAGISALVVGLQPLLTAALAAPLLGERVSRRRWAGILIGLLGSALVLGPRLSAGALPTPALAVCALAMLAITLGTFWQKHIATTADLRAAAAVQFMAALAVTLPVAAATEDLHFDASLPALGALAWAAFGLSIGANSLLLLMIRRGAVARVAALFYLVPPVAAAMAFIGFGEELTGVQIAGMAAAATGVALAARG